MGETGAGELEGVEGKAGKEGGRRDTQLWQEFLELNLVFKTSH